MAWFWRSDTGENKNPEHSVIIGSSMICFEFLPSWISSANHSQHGWRGLGGFRNFWWQVCLLSCPNNTQKFHLVGFVYTQTAELSPRMALFVQKIKGFWFPVLGGKCCTKLPICFWAQIPPIFRLKFFDSPEEMAVSESSDATKGSTDGYLLAKSSRSFRDCWRLLFSLYCEAYWSPKNVGYWFPSLTAGLHRSTNHPLIQVVCATKPWKF